MLIPAQTSEAIADDPADSSDFALARTLPRTFETPCTHSLESIAQYHSLLQLPMVIRRALYHPGTLELLSNAQLSARSFVQDDTHPNSIISAYRDTERAITRCTQLHATFGTSARCIHFVTVITFIQRAEVLVCRYWFVVCDVPEAHFRCVIRVRAAVNLGPVQTSRVCTTTGVWTRIPSVQLQMRTTVV